MAKKEKPRAEHRIEGRLIFKSVDRMTAKFEMEDKGQTGRFLSFPANLFPSDFDPTMQEVTGTYMVRFLIRDKEIIDE